MTTITSTFDRGSEGWIVTGDPKSFGWHKTDGNPGGYLGWVDGEQGGICAFSAPASYLGNDKAYYGGTLSYDVVDFSVNNINVPAPDLTISNGKLTLYGTAPVTVGTSWTHETFSLLPRDLFTYDASTGETTPATKQQVKSVLDHLTLLEIRGEYNYGGPEKGGLDNVALSAKNKADLPSAHQSDLAHFASTEMLDHHHLAIA